MLAATEGLEAGTPLFRTSLVPVCSAREGRGASIVTLTLRFSVRFMRKPSRHFIVMLICHCNVITDREIREIVLSLLSGDPWGIIVPAKVYRALAKRCKCAGCVPNVVDIITATTAEYHQKLAALPGPVPAAKTPPARRLKRAGGRHERRSPGHRAA
jgi:bacterioferritin-associated ferredoxin